MLSIEEYIAEMRRDIERWKREIADCEKAGAPEIAKTIRMWIVEDERIVAGIG